MKIFKYISKKLFALVAAAILSVTFMLSGCEKYMNVPIPTGQIAGTGIYATNTSAGGILSGVFYNMINQGYTNGNASIGYTTSIYADETVNINPTSPDLFYLDNLSGNNGTFWSPLYSTMYATNSAIAGLLTATASNKNQYLGEAYFSRAWLFFNLVNLYGDVPLPLSTDYKFNNVIKRSPQADVYTQIISDLKTAESLLTTDYHDVNGTVTTLRTRPNKIAVQALLARVYLYQKQWANAEAEASAVIGTSALQLAQLSQAFLAPSTETIWALSPTATSGTFSYIGDYQAYNNGIPSTIPAGKTILSYGPVAALSSTAVASFESNDLRLTTWVNKVYDPSSGKTYYFPNKYKSNLPGAENYVVLRLGEVYLIRAEARAMQNNVSGAQSDINTIRTRASLGATPATDQTGLIAAVAKERRTELFTEQGMRFFDLKRTGVIDAVMNVVAPTKGATWTTQKQLWPLPTTEIVLDPNLTQNPGY